MRNRPKLKTFIMEEESREFVICLGNNQNNPHVECISFTPKTV